MSKKIIKINPIIFDKALDELTKTISDILKNGIKGISKAKQGFYDSIVNDNDK